MLKYNSRDGFYGLAVLWQLRACPYLQLIDWDLFTNLKEFQPFAQKI